MERLIPVADIDDNPFVLRRCYSEQAIEKLCASIKMFGLLQVPVGREVKGRIELAFGMTRLRAYQRLVKESGRFSMMPVRVQNLSDIQMALLAWTENHEREDVSPVDQALFIRETIGRFGWRQEEAAQKFGMSRPALSNKLRLLNLPEPAQEALRRGQISERQAMAMLSGGTRSVEQLVAAAKEGVSSDVIRRIRKRRDPHEMLEASIAKAVRIARAIGYEHIADALEEIKVAVYQVRRAA